MGTFFRVVAFVLVCFLIMGAATAAYFWKDIERQIHRKDLPGLVEAAGSPTLNILVIGTDSRESPMSREDIKRFGRVGGKRADTIILVQVVPSQRRAALVAFPRDLWVPIPGHGINKINSAFQYGPDVVIEAVHQISGVSINHYVEVNFNGFRRLVDSIGGIDVCLDRAMNDKMLQFRLPGGVSHLDGNAALTFVRSRHADADGDFGRIRRQQQFLRTVVAKLGRPSVLVNPFRVHSLATAFAANVTTDRDFKLTDMAKLARNVKSVSPEQMQTYTVPGELGRAGGQSVVLPDTERANVLFGALRDAIDPAQALAPNPVRVAVEDASGRGIAAAVASELTKRGFVVTRSGPAARTQRRSQVISPGPLFNDARRVVVVVPGAQLLRGGTEIRLVLGTGFRELAQAPKGEAPAPGGPCANFKPGD